MGCRVRRNFSDRSAHDTVLSSWMDKALPFPVLVVQHGVTRGPHSKRLFFRYGCTCLARRTLCVSSIAFGALVVSLQVHLGRVSRTILQSISSAFVQGQWRNPCALCWRDMDKSLLKHLRTVRRSQHVARVENWRCILARAP